MASYGTKDDFVTYMTMAGYAAPTDVTDEQLNAALLRGSRFIDTYERKFPGIRSNGFVQDRAWPRRNSFTNYGEAIPDDVIPQAVINAAYEAGYLELTSPNSLSPVVTLTEVVKREKVGQLEVEYAGVSGTTAEEIAQQLKPIVATIDGLLWPFLYCPSVFAMVV